MKPVIGYSGVKNKPYRVVEGGYLRLSNGAKMYFPEGYIFDNGSIPHIFKWLADTFDIEFFKYKEYSFLIHDYLYNHRGYRLTKLYKHEPITRSFADNEMAYQMRLNGDSENKVKVFFLAVRLFGWLHYGKI